MKRYWRDIGHQELTAAIEAAAIKHRWTLLDKGKRLTVDDDGIVSSIVVPVVMPGVDEVRRTWAHAIGMVNDLRGHRRLEVFAGITDGETELWLSPTERQRKRTERAKKDIDLSQMAFEICHNYADVAWLIPHKIEALKATRISWRESDEILMGAGRARYLPWSRIGKVEKLFGRRGSCWDLLLAYHEGTRKNPHHMKMAQCSGFAACLPC